MIIIIIIVNDCMVLLWMSELIDLWYMSLDDKSKIMGCAIVILWCEWKIGCD